METKLGDLQLAIMDVLWRQGEATAAQVHRALFEERGLAPTTIATMLVKMEKKGVVEHRTEGRRFVYRSTLSRRQAQRSAVADVMQRLFAGDATALVSHLLSDHEIDSRELSQLQELLHEHERDEQPPGEES